MERFKHVVKKPIFGFVITGLLSTGIMFGLYVILQKLMSYQYAYLLAYSISVITLYFMNLVVFKKPILLRSFLGFPLIYFLQYLVSAASLGFIVRLGFPVTFAPLLVFMILLPITFKLNRMIL